MKNNFIKNLKTPKRRTFKEGFTLIEALVGITILLVAVIGPLYIAFQGVTLAFLARDQTIASFLAQEGVEFVRFRINTNDNEGNIGKDLLTATDYDLTKCSWQLNGYNYCIIDPFTDTVYQCDVYMLPGNECPYLKYDTANKKYNYTSGDDTLFRRSIRINHDSTLPDNEIVEFQIESKVEWGRPDDPHSIVLKEIIRDWWP